MRTAAVALVVVLVLAGTAAADGGGIRGQLEELFGIAAAHEARLVELERQVDELEARVGKLETRLARVELCTLRRPLVFRPVPGRSPFAHCRWFVRPRR